MNYNNGVIKSNFLPSQLIFDNKYLGNISICPDCIYWDYIHGGCKIHNTIPAGCSNYKDKNKMEYK